jgi:hypothetical protein
MSTPDPRPNEISLDPAGHRASERLDAFFERLDRMPTARLEMLAVRPLDEAGHHAATDRALDAVRRLGREELLRRGRETVEETAPRRYAADTLWVAGIPIGPAIRPVDLSRLVATLRDAVLALVAADGVDADTFDELVGPCVDLVPGPVET